MAWFLLITAVMAIVFLPLLAVPRKATVWMARHWARATLWGLKVFAGIGDAADRRRRRKGGVLVASKHMSMWDTLALYLALEDPGIVLKRELLRIPFYGWYLWKAAAIAIDRGAGADALRRMTHAAETRAGRRPPDSDFPGRHPQKAGRAAGLQTRRGGALWPAGRGLRAGGAGFRASTGRAFSNGPARSVLEFLEPIPPGMKRRDFHGAAGRAHRNRHRPIAGRQIRHDGGAEETLRCVQGLLRRTKDR